MGAIREHFEKYWNGEVDPDKSPPFVPILQAEEVADGVAFVSSFANATAVRTGEGLVIVDPGSFILYGQVFAGIRSVLDAPARTIVYTHGHVDHCFGVEQWEEDAKARGAKAPEVIAHEDVPARFDRYLRTRGWNACINARQFQSAVEWPKAFRYPDRTFRDRLRLELAGEPVEIVHARGETDDAAWVWLPTRKVVCTGDLFIWAAPNAGNPQKVQRYPREWAEALRRIRALDAEVLCPGHGPPIFGADRVSRALDETASLLEALHDQTVAMMNQGATLDDILGSVRAPAHLLERPYLRPLYDEPEFVVRNTWRLYGGWWDGNPANLKPAREAELAGEIALLAGGAHRLAERAEALVRGGRLALAGHLAEYAVRAAPDDEAVWEARSRVNRARMEAERSLMARGVFRAAADQKKP
ncbi:MAG: MBL fold metallo-hydrolase [Myxococcales bacterium]|nr:MBL fold metallo-hydrolase [Myxococcales bacterium]